MTEKEQELAALHALGLLPPDEAKAFETNLASDSELRQEFAELLETVGDFGRLAPAEEPPARVRNQVMEEIVRLKTEQKEPVREKIRIKVVPLAEEPSAPAASYSSSTSSPGGGWSILAWGLAAAFAASGAWLWSERGRLHDNVSALTVSEAQLREHLINSEKQAAQLQTEVDRSKGEIDKLSGEVANWKKETALAKMEIATLQSTVDEFHDGVAVVVWDSDKQQGILKLEKMPPVEQNKDYQLWVVDPKKPEPVDAGVVRIDKTGYAQIEFKPADIVSEVAKFALSIEKEGGVPKGEGPIIFMGR